MSNDPDATNADPESVSPPKKTGVSSTMKIAAVAAVVILLVAVPMGYFILTQDDDEGADFSVGLTGKGEEEETVDHAALEDMDFVEAVSSYQNRFNNWKGNGTYGGVELRDLADLVGGMAEGDVMTVTASDGYAVNLSYEQVYASTEYLAIQGQIILAYEFNGSIMSEEDLPMIAVLAPDEAFSNDDFNATAPEGPEFEMLTSAGSMWVKMVSNITIGELGEHEVVLTVDGATTVDLTLYDLQSMDTMTSDGGLIKSTGTVEGPFEFTGVALRDLVDLVYSGDDYSLEVVATDGYTMTYTNAQVENGTYEHYDSTGASLGTDDFTMVVAYAQDGLPLVDIILRIAIIDDSAPITDGHFWAKHVRTVNVVSPVKDYTLEINGTKFYEMDRPTFESIASCDYHALSWSFENETGTHTYTGVSLWTLVSAVDGADGPDNEYLFNDLLAFAGYSVRVTAEDGYNKVFTSMQVARNDSIIVADKLDGEPLPDGEWPLRIVGDWLSGSMKVSQVVNISLEGLQAVPDWELTITGTETVTISAETFASTYYSGLHGPWFNYTDYGGWHATYHNYTDDLEVDHTYAGIPLWVLVAAVDGEDLYHYEFNETLAETGYLVNVSASDGYYKTFSIEDVAYNDSFVVAFMLDWEFLVDDEYPLKLTGEWLTGSQKIKSVAAIELEGLP
jgi:DMSO/TMAO reductase YedYZ molybdopterin-dependent catalytic subunit